MPYNPSVNDNSAEFIFRGLESAGQGIGGGLQAIGQKRHAAAMLEKQFAEQQKQQDKENAGLTEGFRLLHEHSPELQKLFPVKDWGDVSPNAVKGMLAGMNVMGEQIKMQAAAAEMQRMEEDRAALRGAAAFDKPEEQLKEYWRKGGQNPTIIGALLDETAKAPFEPKLLKLPGSELEMVSTSRNSWMPNPLQAGGKFAAPADGPVVRQVNGRDYVLQGNEWKAVSQTREDQPLVKLTPYELGRKTAARAKLEDEISAFDKQLETASDWRIMPGETKSTLLQQRRAKEIELEAINAVLQQGGAVQGAAASPSVSGPAAASPKPAAAGKLYKMQGGSMMINPSANRLDAVKAAYEDGAIDWATAQKMLQTR